MTQDQETPMPEQPYTRIPAEKLREVLAYCEAATEEPWEIEYTNTGIGVHPVCDAINATFKHENELMRVEAEATARLIVAARTDLPRNTKTLLAADVEIDTLQARVARLDKALEDESRAAREVFEELQRVSTQRDGSEDKYKLADTVVQSLSQENVTLQSRVEELEKGLLEAKIAEIRIGGSTPDYSISLARGYDFSDDPTYCSDEENCDHTGSCVLAHNARIKALLPKEGGE